MACAAFWWTVNRSRELRPPASSIRKCSPHLPLLLHREPQRALTVGFGSGGTSHSMALHGIRVDCVEIETAVPAAAEYFEAENRDILSRAAFPPHHR